MPTVHIESKRDEIANIVLMPGDPNRSEYIAKKYLKDYKLVNSVRGMKAYTGYYKEEIEKEIEQLKKYPNVILKYGRYKPNSVSRFDDVLQITLASDNQYAERIS